MFAITCQTSFLVRKFTNRDPLSLPIHDTGKGGQNNPTLFGQPPFLNAKVDFPDTAHRPDCLVGGDNWQFTGAT